MRMDQRKKDADWNVVNPETGNAVSWDSACCAVLMDLRDELKKLNNLLHCSNFQNIPRKLDRISHNTAKPRNRK